MLFLKERLCSCQNEGSFVVWKARESWKEEEHLFPP